MDQGNEHEAGPATPRPQHTPGPWVYDPDHGEVVSFAVSGRYIVAESVTRRNGPAIAALPELVAALKVVVERATTGDGTFHKTEVLRIQRLIARVEGREQ